ncbi:MAG: bifunctional adenosylcobinamide kinase/adenosylcobinamide-phosphate guanylyltransferase [Christensenellaceae bacterium]
MGKMIYVTGGARSGKSHHAQMLAQEYSDVAYVATAINTDAEMQQRIKKHIQDRPSNWKTYECAYDMTQVLSQNKHKVVLIDCMTVYVTNLIFKNKQNWDNIEVLASDEAQKIEQDVLHNVERVLDIIKNTQGDFILVSNEVGMGVVPEYPLGRLFRDIAGRVNRMIAEAANVAYFVVSGIPIKIKE